MDATNRPLVWFSRVMWLGIVVNVGLAIATLVAPARILALNGLPPASPLLWPRFASWLLILLSVFYIPAAADPSRYRLNAKLAVLARFAGVMFFSTQPSTYWGLGGVDLMFFLPQAILLAASSSSASPDKADAAARTTAL
jgi:hypothetical protein